MRDGHFSVDDRVFQITGIEMGDAISIARNLVEYTTTGKFMARTFETAEQESMRVPMRPLLPGTE